MAGDSIAPANNLLSRSLIGAQIGLIVLSMIVTRSTAMSLQARTGLPRGNQVADGTPVPEVPASLSSSPFRSLTLTDARISLFFLTLLQSAFFSTGNMASISSFSLDSVNRLIPVFDPFSQGALLIVKLMIPFALISANLGILNKRLGVAPSALFMVVIAISDFLTLHFFWVVKDEGSWLEIGSTISHFIIASLLCLFVASLEGVSEIFISGVEVEDSSSQLGKERELGGVIREEKKLVNGSTKASVNGKST
ncbi:Glycosyl phosphatidyl inositol anchor synthesis [Ciborinia camelliae]|nr:Glycosyl phosphatidyl inositol anchor synthesis [Ciborinia camelliae]